MVCLSPKAENPRTFLLWTYENGKNINVTNVWDSFTRFYPKILCPDWHVTIKHFLLNYFEFSEKFEYTVSLCHSHCWAYSAVYRYHKNAHKFWVQMSLNHEKTVAKISSNCLFKLRKKPCKNSEFVLLRGVNDTAEFFCIWKNLCESKTNKTHE